jgi:hypothetical protein
MLSQILGHETKRLHSSSTNGVLQTVQTFCSTLDARDGGIFAANRAWQSPILKIRAKASSDSEHHGLHVSP